MKVAGHLFARSDLHLVLEAHSDLDYRVGYGFSIGQHTVRFQFVQVCF